jgi:hypothetical protein
MHRLGWLCSIRCAASCMHMESGKGTNEKFWTARIQANEILALVSPMFSEVARRIKAGKSQRPC